MVLQVVALHGGLAAVARCLPQAGDTFFLSVSLQTNR